MNKMVSVPSIKLSELKKLISSLENLAQDDMDLSFEFIIGSLFPKSWKAIQEDLNRQYTLGYLQGKKDSENLKKL